MPRAATTGRRRSIDAPAAIDNQHGTGHKAGPGASQIDGGWGDLLGLREPFERRAVEPSLAFRRIAQRLLGHRRDDHPRTDRVHVDVPGAQSSAMARVSITTAPFD